MKLAYRSSGEGTPLIILHGLFGQSDNWNTLARQFGENGFKAFTVDQRNHGLSPHDDTWTYAAMADDLHEFIADHDLKDPILLGHSMGGKTVLFHEHKYPGTAAKLVIADMAARKYDNHHRDVLAALNAVDLTQINNRKEAEAILGRHISDHGTKQFLLKNIYWKDQERGLMDWRFNLKVITARYNNVSEIVPDFRSDTPTLVVRGEKSKYVNEEDLDDYRKRFSDLKVSTINGAGHWVHAEKPAEFFSEVMQFISA